MIIDTNIPSAFINRRQTINCHGRLIDLSAPVVMGIVNATPDSFFAGSRFLGETDILKRVEQILSEGGTMVDVGAYSSRPGAEHITADEEITRLMPVLESIRKHFPHVIISIDTFRASVANKAVSEGEADIVNDISGGEMDPAMFEAVANLKVPYVLMHMQGTPQNMHHNPTYHDLMSDISKWLSVRVNALRAMGVADIIIDPGFGFGKTLHHNFMLLKELNQFKLFELPVLVGVSRKSMVYKLLDVAVEDALNGTTVLNTFALQKGANILRVHDVKEAVQCVALIQKLTDGFRNLD